MSYMHIENLLKAQEILLFKEAYAMEKIHGSSSKVSWRDGQVVLSPGGVSAVNFSKIFITLGLEGGFTRLGHSTVVVYGEVYGAKTQGMKATYGVELKFIAFEVQIGACWLAVPDAEEVVKSLGLEFVHYVKVRATLEELDVQRLAPSEQAFRNGCAERDKPETHKKREGIVLRPLIELTKNNGERVICKFKNEEFSERASKVDTTTDPAKLQVLTEADDIADEFVTEQRLTHVLDKLGNPTDLSRIPEIIAAMLEDVEREGHGEVNMTKEARRAIGTRTGKMVKIRFTENARAKLTEGE